MSKNINIGLNDLIVVLEIGGLGDFIMATPTLITLRESYPNNPITLLVAERSLPLANDFSTMTLEKPIQVIPFKTTGNFFLRNIRNLFQIKKIAQRKPKLLIDLSAIESDAAAKRRQSFIQLFKSKVTAGRNTDRRGTFHNFSSNEILFSKQHEVNRKLEVLHSIGMKSTIDRMYFPVDDTSRKLVNVTVTERGLQSKNIIGINTGAYRANRRWPVENIISILLELRSDSSHFLVFGGPGDEEFIDKISQSIDPELITIISNESFQMVGAWLEVCSLFITNDTGLMHFAAALKIPTIALFGPENPFRYVPWGDFPKHIIKYYPEGENIFTESNYFHDNAIQMIKTQQVLEAARAYLKTGAFT